VFDEKLAELEEQVEWAVQQLEELSTENAAIKAEKEKLERQLGLTQRKLELLEQSPENYLKLKKQNEVYARERREVVEAVRRIRKHVAGLRAGILEE
jgi:regulator of replication initiation timing